MQRELGNVGERTSAAASALWALAIWALLAVGCDELGGDACAPGEVGCECAADGSCIGALSCVSDRCVDLSGDGDADGDGTPMDGGASGDGDGDGDGDDSPADGGAASTGDGDGDGDGDAECSADADCDDGVACTRDACDAGVCVSTADDARCPASDCASFGCDATDGCVQTAAEADETPCNDDDDLCTTGVCDGGSCVETPIDCSDGVDCTDDICVDGVCTDNVANDDNCDDGEACTRDICDAVSGCGAEPIPNFGACDDGDADTFPDVCRNDVCIGATQRELDTGTVGSRVVDAALGDNSTYVLVDGDDDSVRLYEVVGSADAQIGNARVGRGNRLFVDKTTVFVAGEVVGDTAGGLNCAYRSSGPCPLLGVYSENVLSWNGTAMHTALNGSGLSSLHGVQRFLEVEGAASVCGSPPCFDELRYFFAGARQGDATRPSVMQCLSDNGLSCSQIGNNYASSDYDGAYFVSAEVSRARDLQEPRYLTGLFALNEGTESTVLIDFDADPDDILGAVRQGPFTTQLSGGYRRACNSYSFFGDGGAVICTSGNTASLGQPCETNNTWGCSEVLDGAELVDGENAGWQVMVEPTRVHVLPSGDPSSDDAWVPIDFDPPSNVRLAAVAGDIGEWLVFANDTGSGKVRIYRFRWSP